MQEPREKVLELNKVKKLQKIPRLSSVTMYSNCCTTQYSLSLLSKVKKNLLVNYLAADSNCANNAETALLRFSAGRRADSSTTSSH